MNDFFFAALELAGGPVALARYGGTIVGALVLALAMRAASRVFLLEYGKAPSLALLGANSIVYVMICSMLPEASTVPSLALAIGMAWFAIGVVSTVRWRQENEPAVWTVFVEAEPRA